MTDTLVPAPDWPFLKCDENSGMYGSVLMSNFDHEVDHNVAQRLRNEQALAEYTGWDFHAVCWHADGYYCAEVSCYGVHRATFSANTPEELMQLVCEGFGSD